jgi:hypothetical protein
LAQPATQTRFYIILPLAVCRVGTMPIPGRSLSWAGVSRVLYGTKLGSDRCASDLDRVRRAN